MKRIGLSQRVEVVPSYGERRDCLDQNWARFMQEAGFVPIPLSNAVTDVGSYVESLGLAGVVLTGGNDIARLDGARNRAPERDRFESALIAECYRYELPVLGVCRGMQLLNLEHGGRLDVVDGHVAARHPVTVDGELLDVNSFHRYAVPPTGLGIGLVAGGCSDDGTIEALRHDDGRCAGIMWHPERELPFRAWDLGYFRRVLGADA